jgi:hypothetical protein
VARSPIVDQPVPSVRPKNEAEVRGEIDAGLHGDKKPGFDPAAAPMETDAEAGAEQAATQTNEPLWDDQPAMQDSDGDALRDMPSAQRAPVPGFLWPFMMVMLFLAVVGTIFAVNG